MPNTFRFLRGAGQDKTLRTITQDSLAVAYAATIAVNPIEQRNLYQIAQLTGTLTINATITSLYIGDVVRFLFSSDGTARVVTFGTGFLSAGTASITASKTGYVEFMFNGTALQEVCRAVTA